MMWLTLFSLVVLALDAGMSIIVLCINNIVTIIIIILLCMHNVYLIHAYTLLFLTAPSAMPPVQFRDLSLTITEGEPKAVGVELTANISQSLSIPVYVLTLSRFQEAINGSQCGLSPDDVSLNSSILSLDPAEGTNMLAT